MPSTSLVSRNSDVRHIDIHDPKLQNPLSIVGSFLGDYDRARMQPVSSTFSSLFKFQDLEYYKEIHQYKLRTNLAKCLGQRSFIVFEEDDLKIKNLDHVGCFTKVLYYCGWHDKCLDKKLEHLLDERMKTVEEHSLDERMKTLEALKEESNYPTFRDLHFFVIFQRTKFSREIRCMEIAVKQSHKRLMKRTDELHFLIAAICKIVQKIVEFIMPSSNIDSTLRQFVDSNTIHACRYPNLLAS